MPLSTMLKRNIKESDEEYCRARGLSPSSTDSSLDSPKNKNDNKGEIVSELRAIDIDEGQHHLIEAYQDNTFEACETSTYNEDDHHDEDDSGPESEDEHQAYDYDSNHDSVEETQTDGHDIDQLHEDEPQINNGTRNDGTKDELSDNSSSVKFQRIKHKPCKYTYHKKPKPLSEDLVEKLRQRALDLQVDEDHSNVSFPVLSFRRFYQGLESFNLLSFYYTGPRRQNIRACGEESKLRIAVHLARIDLLTQIMSRK